MKTIDSLTQEVADLTRQVEVAQELARRCLDLDTEIPEGAEGRDKAFALLETWCGNLQFLARHLTTIKA